MELRQYLRILIRRKWIVLVTAGATLLIVGMATLFTTPVYSASATMRIAQVQDRFIDYYDLNYSTRLINTYAELVRSRPFLQETINRLKVGLDPAALSEMVRAEALPNTELLVITAESPDPVAAMLIANTVGQLLIEEGEGLYSGQGKSASEIIFEQLASLEGRLKADRERLQALLAEEGGRGQSAEIQDFSARLLVEEQNYSAMLDAYEEAKILEEARANSVSTADPAVAPQRPARPRAALNLALGGLVGLLGGIGLAFLMDNLDIAVYSPEELEHNIPAPLLGLIPELKVPARLRNGPFLLQPNGRSGAAEAFRILKSNLLMLDGGMPPKTLLVTSVEPGAGKSTVLSNLAIAMGQAGRRIVVVDCDLRSPSLHKLFGVPNSLGLKNLIIQERNLSSAELQSRIPNVGVIPSGPLPQNPADLLGLPRLNELLHDLANRADLVLLDSPSMMQFSDAVVLAPHVDGVALVVSRGSVTGDHVRDALSLLRMAGAEQIGIIFNRAETHRNICRSGGISLPNWPCRGSNDRFSVQEQPQGPSIG